MAKPQIILEIKTYADGVLVDQTAKVVEPEPNLMSLIILALVIPWPCWLMAMGGMFK